MRTALHGRPSIARLGAAPPALGPHRERRSAAPGAPPSPAAEHRRQRCGASEQTGERDRKRGSLSEMGGRGGEKERREKQGQRGEGRGRERWGKGGAAASSVSPFAPDHVRDRSLAYSLTPGPGPSCFTPGPGALLFHKDPMPLRVACSKGICRSRVTATPLHGASSREAAARAPCA